MRILEKMSLLMNLLLSIALTLCRFIFALVKIRKGGGCRVATGGDYSKCCKLTLSLLIWYPPLALVCKHTSGFLPPNFFP